MQVSVEDLNSVKKTLHIEIPADTITRELDKAYEELKKRAKLKGFRPGKAPRGVLEQYYRKDVHADVTSRLIQESFLEAIKENDLKIVGSPDIDPPELTPKEPYKYSATVEIRPDIDPIDFKGLSLKKTRYQVSDEEMEAQLSALQQNLAKYEAIEEDRPVAQEDFVLMDYEGFQNEEPLDDLQKTENFMLRVGDGRMTQELDEGLVGLRPGEEKEIPVTFPDDYQNKNLAGQSASIKVVLKEIRKQVLPDIDDDFAKNFGEYENIDGLKKAIEDNLEEGYQKRSEQEMNEQIFEALLEKTNFEVPDTLVNYELDGIIADAERYFSYHNVPMDQAGLTREKLAEQYRDVAVKQVRRHLILDKIIEQETLTLTDDEEAAGFEEMAKSFNQPVEQVRSYYQQDTDKLESFKQALLEKQAVKLITENSTIQEVDAEPEPEAEKEGEKTE
jgi:trigger factor